MERSKSSSGRMNPEDDLGWRHYPETILEIALDPCLTIDLRQPVPDEARARLRDAGLTPSFAVVTACNPRGRATTGTENDRRTLDLRTELDRRGCSWIAADGLSIDRQHREPGAAIVMPQADACDLAHRYEQSGLFWYDGADFWLVGVLVEAPQARLPLD